MPAAPSTRPWVFIDAEDVDRPAYDRLREACLKFGFLPTFSEGLVLVVGMLAPEDETIVSELRQLTHQEVHRFGILETDFDRAISGLGYSAAVEASDRKDCGVGRWPDQWSTESIHARALATELVQRAFRAGASDLIVDEQEDRWDVAVKRAGQKEILPPLERDRGVLLLKAFKEMAGMPAHASNTAISGAASVAIDATDRAELRLEITPTVHGESLVARIQNRRQQLERMQELPFAEAKQSELVRRCLRQRQGLIVVTGPTGHGKTSTLYACLGQLDASRLNIRTLEDPVEFQVPWITQIPVGAGTGRSFGEGLKSLLRQAPDVILLGEIRDRPVAQTCLEAVDTGHLILATLHARDAIGVVSRLLDLEVSGRQIASSLLLVIAQRLVRRLCPACRRPAVPTASQLTHYRQAHLDPPAILFVPGGCPACSGQGETGVVPLFEFFHPPSDSTLGDLLGAATTATWSETAIRGRWEKTGGRSLVQAGLDLAARGEIAYAEVLKYERNPPFI